MVNTVVSTIDYNLDTFLDFVVCGGGGNFWGGSCSIADTDIKLPFKWESVSAYFPSIIVQSVRNSTAKVYSKQ